MDTRRFAMNYGAFLGLGLILISLTVYLFGLEEQKSIIPSLLNNLLIIGAIIYSVIIFKNQNNGFISYAKSLKLGTSVVFFASVLLAFYTFIFVTFINPEYLVNIIDIAEQEILKSNPEISDEDLDMALNFTHKMLQPQWMATFSVLGGTFMGFFYSLIISFFVKNDFENAEDIFESNDDKNFKKINNFSSTFLLISSIVAIMIAVTFFHKLELGGLPTAIFYLVVGLLTNFVWKKFKK